MPENIVPPIVSDPVGADYHPPVVPAPKKYPLLTTILLILLSLLATLAIYLFLQVRTLTLEKLTSSPTPVPSPMTSPDPTTGWETYDNKEYNFLLSHPIDWEIRDVLVQNKTIPSHRKNLLFLGIAPIFMKEDFIGSVIVTTEKLEKVIADHKVFPDGAPNILVSEKQIDFLSFGATELISKNTSNNVMGKEIIFEKDGKTYIISGSNSNDEPIDQILSTFKFTTNQ